MSEVPVQTVVSAIRARARELGLSHIGFAPARPPARAAFFQQWLREGKAGTMTYLKRGAARRQDPQLILPGARTVISVAESYFSGWLPDEIRKDPSRGIIAAYAGGEDYHHVLLDKVRKLAELVQECAPGSQSACCTDTGAILEREFGEQAGIGFIGKNTLLISPRFGSTFFLGEILTTLDLPAEEPARMPSCGSCHRCQDACPTHAFPVPYVLDSNLCISYLTIEYHGVIPRELRGKMGNHIFGCDDCQTVCPWNERFATATAEAAYRASLERQAPRLAELVELTAARYEARYTGTAVLRQGYTGFLRNVAVALGNWGTTEAFETLGPLLRHHKALIRQHAVWAAGRTGDVRARALLQSLARYDASAAVRAEAALSLAEGTDL